MRWDCFLLGFHFSLWEEDFHFSLWEEDFQPSLEQVRGGKEKTLFPLTSFYFKGNPLSVPTLVIPGLLS
jgi:hypothetical protein